MAAIYWHLHIAEEILHRMQGEPEKGRWEKAILLHPDFFSSGCIGPDLNYFPGGEKALSRLAHQETPIDLGKALLVRAESPVEEAYACGWMLHIVTDLITHQLVNRLVAERFHATADAFRYTNDPLGHHRIEWGIDATFVQKTGLFSRLPQPEILARATGRVSPMLSRVCGEVYGETPVHETWVRAHSGMNRILRLVGGLWRITGRIRDPRRFAQIVKSFFYFTTVLPLARTFAVRSPESGVGLIIPVLPSEEDRLQVRDLTERVCNAYRVQRSQRFEALTNRPLEG